MYRFNKNKQMSLSDFNQPIGLKMNQDNRRIKMAESIPWDEIEVKYAALFRGENRDTYKASSDCSWVLADSKVVWLF